MMSMFLDLSHYMVCASTFSLGLFLCDQALRPWAQLLITFNASHFVDGKELILALQSHDGRSGDRA
jgi:hypothetical protein